MTKSRSDLKKQFDRIIREALNEDGFEFEADRNRFYQKQKTLLARVSTRAQKSLDASP